MTANAIVEKLNAVIAKPIDSECKVVYVLCEVRKLLESIPANQRPWALNMYCHWALHVDLHGENTIRSFLEQVDTFVRGFLKGIKNFDASHRMFRDFVFSDTFRSQLRDFLQANRIRSDLTDENVHWNEFVTQYAGVIEDGSLSIRAENHGIRQVKQVTFTKDQCETDGFDLIPFDMTWAVTLLNGRSVTVRVNARLARNSADPSTFCEMRTVAGEDAT